VSLFSLAERFTSLDHSALEFDPGRCLHSQDRFSGCQACFAICPVAAITPGKPPSLDPKKCDKCMACLMVCPVGAYRADDEVATLLAAVKRLEGAPLELLCERNPRPAQGVSKEATAIRIKGCLAGLGVGTYLVLAALGHDRILVRTEACSACLWAALPGEVQAQVSHARQLLQGWGKDSSLISVSELASPVERPLWESASPPLSRRDIFQTALSQGRASLARVVDEWATPPADRQPGRDRLRMLTALKHLPSPPPVRPGSLQGLDFAWLSVSDACTACGVCARICPTGALQFGKYAGETAFQLTFQAAKCISCDMCTHVCSPAAMTLDHAPTFARIFSQEIVIIRSGALIKCKKCGAPTVALPGVELCPPCEFRRLNPFGSMLPPGLKSIKPSAAPPPPTQPPPEKLQEKPPEKPQDQP
jgi:ferredoxin